MVVPGVVEEFPRALEKVLLEDVPEVLEKCPWVLKELQGVNGDSRGPRRCPMESFKGLHGSLG